MWALQTSTVIDGDQQSKNHGNIICPCTKLGCTIKWSPSISTKHFNQNHWWMVCPQLSLTVDVCGLEVKALANSLAKLNVFPHWCAACLSLDRGYCDCGTCECDEGWSGDACHVQEECNLSKRKSKELCKNPQGVVCSNRGSAPFFSFSLCHTDAYTHKLSISYTFCISTYCT